MDTLSISELTNSYTYTPPKRTRQLSDYDKWITHCCNSYNTRTTRFNRNPAVITPRERKHLSNFRDFCAEHGLEDYEQLNSAFDKVLDSILKERWVGRMTSPLKISDLLANDKLVGRFNLDWFDVVNGSDPVPLISETNNIDVIYKSSWLGQIVERGIPTRVRLVGGSIVQAYPIDLADVSDHSFYEQALNDEGFRKTKAYLAYLAK